MPRILLASFDALEHALSDLMGFQMVSEDVCMLCAVTVV